MLRHSANTNLRERKKKQIENNNDAEKYLQSPKFHKQLRKGFKALKSIWKKSVPFEKPAENRIDMDNSTKAEICRDKSSDWIITKRDRKNQKHNNH